MISIIKGQQQDMFLSWMVALVLGVVAGRLQSLLLAVKLNILHKRKPYAKLYGFVVFLSNLAFFIEYKKMVTPKQSSRK